MKFTIHTASIAHDRDGFATSEAFGDVVASFDADYPRAADAAGKALLQSIGVRVTGYVGSNDSVCCYGTDRGPLAVLVAV